MTMVISLVGVFIAGFSLLLVLQPTRLAGMMALMEQSKNLYYVALGRFLVGSLFIAAAPVIAYGHLISILGWILVLAGLIMVVVPHKVFLPLVRWAGAWPTGLVRVTCLMPLLLGCFLVYAANQ